MKRRYILLFIGSLLALNILCWREVFALAGPQYLEVSFFDVGQGDSAFIQTPQGHQILIDGGPDSSVLEKLADKMPFWDKMIDLVILTHPEKDHMAGILDVLQRYKVDYFLWTGIVKDDAENKKLANILNKIQSASENFLLASLNQNLPTKVLTASADQEIKAGEILIDILFPFENLSGKKIKNTSNDTCVVLKVMFGDKSFLFAGDIGNALEKRLVGSLKSTDLKADVLKVAHHGSKYSTSELFLKNVNPKIAVIEVGKNNYGHPTPEVLQKLERFGIKIFRTDINGDIRMVADKNNLISVNSSR